MIMSWSHKTAIPCREAQAFKNSRTREVSFRRVRKPRHNGTPAFTAPVTSRQGNSQSPRGSPVKCENNRNGLVKNGGWAKTEESYPTETLSRTSCVDGNRCQDAWRKPITRCTAMLR